MQHKLIVRVTDSFTWGLYYKSRFGVNEVTSGSTQGFLYHDGGSLVTGVDCHGNTC